MADFLLSWFNLAGSVGAAGFGAFAVLWVVFAVRGLRAILRGDVPTHRRWMLRTFAMTYAAVPCDSGPDNSWRSCWVRVGTEKGAPELGESGCLTPCSAVIEEHLSGG